MTVHWVADGHAIPRTPFVAPLKGTTVGVPGACGSKVTSCPLSSPAVHWLSVGHWMRSRSFSPTLSTVVEGTVTSSLLAGSIVNTSPTAFPIVHCEADGHAIDSSGILDSVTEVAPAGSVGLKVKALPNESTARH